MISEAGYFLFFGSIEQPTEQLADLRTAAVEKAFDFLKLNVAELAAERDELSPAEADEVERLARWLRHYFLAEKVSLNEVKVPNFRGHGFISACKGDFEFSNKLVEMKYVDRQFRSHDLRQLIIYAALRYFAGQPPYEALILMNPLRGVEFVTNIDEIIYSASGSDAPEFFQRLSYAISSGEISH